MNRFEEEQRLLNERRKQAIEKYHKKKGGSSYESARSLSPLSSGDVRNVNLAEYQDVPRGATPNEERDRMEQKVREEIMSSSDFLPSSEQGSSSETFAPPRTRVLSTPTNSPMRERRQRAQSHTAQSNSSRTAVVSRAVPQPSVSAPGGNNRVVSSIVLPTASRVPQLLASMSAGSGIAVLPVASPQAYLNATPGLANLSTQRPSVPHSDSGEWTPYASAPPPPASGASGSESSSAGTIGEVASRTTDLSEFDPMAKNRPL